MSVYIGIDWSEAKHDVVFLNEAGVQIAYLCIPHALEGFMLFDRQRAKLGLTLSECVLVFLSIEKRLSRKVRESGSKIGGMSDNRSNGKC